MLVLVMVKPDDGFLGFFDRNKWSRGTKFPLLLKNSNQNFHTFNHI